MTSLSIAEAQSVDETLYCYRHPDRETWIRCGRCDRPICTRCAMQGPVGSRCKQCGTLAFDPLTSFTPRQLTLGIGTALAAGLVGGFISSRIGFFSIFVAFFAGGFIAEIVQRVTGYKREPVIAGILFGGILFGTLLGALISFWMTYGFMLSAVGEGGAALVQPLVVDAVTWALVSGGAACVGAWQRLR